MDTTATGTIPGLLPEGSESMAKQFRLTIDLGFHQSITLAQALWTHARELREQDPDYLTRAVSGLPGYSLLRFAHRINSWQSFTITTEDQARELQELFKAQGWIEGEAPDGLQPVVELVLELLTSEPSGSRRVSVAPPFSLSY